jgi:aspartate 1-decarboxylase
LRWVLRSKIHKATVTEANPAYVGSITIDGDLVERVGLWPNERVLVASNTTGVRLETYVIAGAPGSGEICMNGPTAHLISVGEEIVIMGFELADRPIDPDVILVDADNQFVRTLIERA